MKIKAEVRTEQGTGAVRRLRRQGLVPGPVMKMDKSGVELIKFSKHEFMMAMRGHTSKQLLVTLEMDGRDVPALMREVQNDVIAGTPIHADFSEVSLSQKVRVVVPVYLTGEPVGVKIGGVFGAKYKKSASVVGGVILILIGVKTVLEHTGIIEF